MKFEPIIEMPCLTTGLWKRFGVHLFEGKVTVDDMEEIERRQRRVAREDPRQARRDGRHLPERREDDERRAREDDPDHQALGELARGVRDHLDELALDLGVPRLAVLLEPFHVLEGELPPRREMDGEAPPHPGGHARNLDDRLQLHRAPRLRATCGTRPLHPAKKSGAEPVGPAPLSITRALRPQSGEQPCICHVPHESRLGWQLQGECPA